MWVYVAVAVFAALSAATGTWKVQDWRYAAKEKERLEAIDRQRRMAEKTIDTAAVSHEQAKTRIQKVFVPIREEVDRVVEKPVYRNVCIDDDGLRLIRTAILGADPASVPAPAVPRPVTSR